MMKKKYRIGLVGFAHMHVLDQIKPFLAMPERVCLLYTSPSPRDS